MFKILSSHLVHEVIFIEHASKITKIVIISYYLNTQHIVSLIAESKTNEHKRESISL
jgi:hypothetical protein